MPKRPLAVVTMCFNEKIFLPLWHRYYSEQVGSENLYILDHGSNDGAADQFSSNSSVIRLPRSDHDDGMRVRVVGKFTASLLESYERVLYVDTDEFIIPDPIWYSGLLDFCAKRAPTVVTMFGLDVVHDMDNEAPADLNAPILQQRKWCVPNAFLCKPSIINREVMWWTGFHGYDGGNHFDNIFLVHLANMDKDLLIEKQRKRNISAPVDQPVTHHKLTPDAMVEIMRDTFRTLPRVTDSDLTMGDSFRETWLDKLFDSGAPREALHMKRHGTPSALCLVPERLHKIL